MEINCDFDVEIKRLEKYFVKYLGFVKTDVENNRLNPYHGKKIKYATKLYKSEYVTCIYIIKHETGNKLIDDDIDFTFQSYAGDFVEYSDYIDYFFNKQDLIKEGKIDFIKKIDNQMIVLDSYE